MIWHCEESYNPKTVSVLVLLRELPFHLFPILLPSPSVSEQSTSPTKCPERREQMKHQVSKDHSSALPRLFFPLPDCGVGLPSLSSSNPPTPMPIPRGILNPRPRFEFPWWSPGVVCDWSFLSNAPVFRSHLSISSFQCFDHFLSNYDAERCPFEDFPPRSFKLALS